MQKNFLNKIILSCESAIIWFNEIRKIIFLSKVNYSFYRYTQRNVHVPRRFAWVGMITHHTPHTKLVLIKTMVLFTRVSSTLSWPKCLMMYVDNVQRYFHLTFVYLERHSSKRFAHFGSWSKESLFEFREVVFLTHHIF